MAIPVKDEPLISIVAPMYNLELYIEQAIDSVLAQTHRNFELILVDDNSVDRTVELVLGYKDPRIRLLRNERNLGAGEARNVGIRAANGSMIAFLDADDTWYADKLERQVEFMASSDTAICYTAYDIIDEDGDIYAESGYMPAVATHHRILRRCFIQTSTVLVDFEKTGRKIEFPQIRKRQDMLVFFDLIKRTGPARLLPVVTCSYRVHQGGLSAKKRSLIPYQWAAYRTEAQLPFYYSVFLMLAWMTLAGSATMIRRMKAAVSGRVVG